MSSPVPEWRPCEWCERKDICTENEECWAEGEINPACYDADSDDQHNDPMGRPTVRIPSHDDPRYWK